ncbi:MAG TPA: DUF885 domain-containing protein [Phenylobacterium sp.]|uniref:DUF885 domain-containing protein n=1 Tax=Phenylobacterium sp. TaxID=1871053 RepID=UPI002B45A19A|nr:DUF885 domain-containing protein [Phenylobacterium sp.]HKR88104.1 DUF885 domain-containing protein [Phenylobacterium sp.]
MNRRALLRSASAAISFAVLPRLASAETAPKSAFAALRDRYFLQALKLNPVSATYLGGDGYSPKLADINGRLRDYSPAALAREADFYRQILAADQAIDPAGLSGQEQIDQQMLRAQVGYMLHQLDRRYQERCLDTYMAEPFRGVDWQIQQMTELGAGVLGTPAEWALVVTRVRAIPAFLATAKANLAAGAASGARPDWRMVQRDGIDAAISAAAYFRKTLPDQASGYIGGRAFDASLLGELKPAGETAAKAFEDFAAFLRQTYPTTDKQDRFAIGEAEYAWRLGHNLRQTRTTGELFAYGHQQVALYQGKVYAVAQEVAAAAGLELPFGGAEEKNASVRKVMEHLGHDSPKSDDELLAWYVETGRRAVQYGRDHKLFDVPQTYRLDVVPTPKVLSSAVDAAYYPAPTFKASGVGRFYLTPTGNDPAALRENNRASVADTAVHEGFPGHDWHYKYMTEHAREISNVRWFTPGAVEDSSSMWEDSLPTEGWALYAEELMSEPAPGRPHGFYDAAEHLYELQGQLLRAVRVVVDVGVHTGRMSYDEAVDYFNANVDFVPGARTRAATDPAARAVFDRAEKAIYRYSKWPTQAITYNLGKAAIIELREAYKAARGPGYQAKEFHERYMRLGPVPPPLMREELLRQAKAAAKETPA